MTFNLYRNYKSKPKIKKVYRYIMIVETEIFKIVFEILNKPKNLTKNFTAVSY